MTSLNEPLTVFTSRGFTPCMDDAGRLILRPRGAPADLVDAAREHRADIIRSLLTPPILLEDMSTEELCTLAWQTSAYLDGGDPYETRIQYMDGYLALTEELARREEIGGNP